MGYTQRPVQNERSLKAGRHVVPRISRETLRRILREGEISWQATTTWQTSTDPDFIAKMHRVLALSGTPPTDGQVICAGHSGVTSGYPTSRSTLIASITTAVAPWML